MAWVARIAALSPEPHTLFTVCAGTDSGIPEPIEAWRAGFMPSPAWSMQPRMVSSTASGGTAARVKASRTTRAPSSIAGTSLRMPPKVPMGVRHPERITISVILRS